MNTILQKFDLPAARRLQYVLHLLQPPHRDKEDTLWQNQREPKTKWSKPAFHL